MNSPRTGIVHQPRGQSTIEYLPLEQVTVKAWVVDVSCRIVLTQQFHNPSDEPTERAKYVFPIPANAAVCAFELELQDGSVIIGEIKEKGEAALAFTSAISQGKTAALVERVTDDIFTISVGSIPANTKVTSHLTFVMDLLDEGLRDHVRLQLPVYIAERYGTPPVAMQHALAPDSRTRVYIGVDIQTSDDIYNIGSPTHEIKLRYYKGHTGRQSRRRISAIWESPEFLTGDFVVRIHAKGLDKPRCFAEVLNRRGSGSGGSATIAMQLTLVPKFQAVKIPSQEFIFVIDRSGSMDTDPIETAKRTLTILLRLLPSAQTTFNIFSFGTKVTSLWKKSHELDRASLVEATLHIEGMSADYGGTEIPKALEKAFGSRALDRPAVVFLLTDGRISNEDPHSIISNAIRTSPQTAPVRLFVLGIGPDVSTDICHSLAQYGNGECLLAVSADDISIKCARLLNVGRSKNIERIDIDWGQRDVSSRTAGSNSSASITNLPANIVALAPPPPVQQAPHLLTKISPGIRFTVFAIISSVTIPPFIRLNVKLQGVAEPQVSVVEVARVKPFRHTDEDSIIPIVHTLAARKLIMELDKKTGPLPIAASGDALIASDDDLRKAGIVRFGLAYKLVSKHTSFVAVQKESQQIRYRRSISSGMGWARSRLLRTDRDAPEDSRTEAPTFIDGIIDDLSSFITSIFGLFSSSRGSTSTTRTFHSRTGQRSRLPGAYGGSDSGISGSDSRGRTRAPSPPHRRSPSSHYSTETFSTISSLEGSRTCSSCWTSRSPSPVPSSPDPANRPPSPDFFQDPAPTIGSKRRDPIPQDAYQLTLEMEVDGSFTASPLLTRLVGDTVLSKAGRLGIDKKVWATVVVVAYMQVHLQSEPDLLELVSAKAEEFVQAFGGHQKRGFEEMVRAATGMLLYPEAAGR